MKKQKIQFIWANTETEKQLQEKKNDHIFGYYFHICCDKVDIVFYCKQIVSTNFSNRMV